VTSGSGGANSLDYLRRNITTMGKQSTVNIEGDQPAVFRCNLSHC
jgi:hypothetical protein